MHCADVAWTLPAAGAGSAVPLARAADTGNLIHSGDGRSPNASCGGADALSADHRETADAYRGELIRTGRFRVAVCRDGRQWLFQRQRPGSPAGGAAWDTFGYCLTRAGLMRLHRAHNGGESPEIASLPEYFRTRVA